MLILPFLQHQNYTKSVCLLLKSERKRIEKKCCKRTRMTNQKYGTAAVLSIFYLPAFTAIACMRKKRICLHNWLQSRRYIINSQAVFANMISALVVHLVKLLEQSWLSWLGKK